MKVAEKCQKLLFSAFRLDAYSDPDSFMLQVAARFSQYDDAVLLRATDPFRHDNIQTIYKFPPSIHEITAALDSTQKAVEAMAYVVERESRGFKMTVNGFVNAAGERYSAAKHGAAK
jgi:hypothetical protein